MSQYRLVGYINVLLLYILQYSGTFIIETIGIQILALEKVDKVIAEKAELLFEAPPFLCPKKRKDVTK